MTAYVILKYCGECQRETPHARKQTTHAENGTITIRTTYECEECETQHHNDREFTD